MKNKFSKTWIRSVQPRKQRKYIYSSPLHLKQKQVHMHLSPELRKKYGFRNIQAKKGDKVKILKGQFKKKEGKIDKVSLKLGRITVTGIETIKKDGTKLSFPLVPSNLMIIELDLNDRKRKQKLELKLTLKTEKSNEKTKQKSGIKQEKTKDRG